jgi:hypothetical protein
MPELKTEQTTTHTLTLTSAELTALRNAACIALDPNARAAFDERHGHPDWYGSPDPEAWRAFAVSACRPHEATPSTPTPHSSAA